MKELTKRRERWCKKVWPYIQALFESCARVELPSNVLFRCNARGLHHYFPKEVYQGTDGISILNKKSPHIIYLLASQHRIAGLGHDYSGAFAIDILLHEAVHMALYEAYPENSCTTSHGPYFRKMAKKVGLTPKGNFLDKPWILQWVAEVLEKEGPFPMPKKAQKHG